MNNLYIRLKLMNATLQAVIWVFESVDIFIDNADTVYDLRNIVYRADFYKREACNLLWLTLKTLTQPKPLLTPTVLGELVMKWALSERETWYEPLELRTRPTSTPIKLPSTPVSFTSRVLQDFHEDKDEECPVCGMSIIDDPEHTVQRDRNGGYYCTG